MGFKGSRGAARQVVAASLELGSEKSAARTPGTSSATCSSKKSFWRTTSSFARAFDWGPIDTMIDP